jgi:hypothetical protein
VDHEEGEEEGEDEVEGECEAEGEEEAEGGEEGEHIQVCLPQVPPITLLPHSLGTK